MTSYPRSLIGFLALLWLAAAAACSTAGAAEPVPNRIVDAPLATARSERTAVLAGGCFWGIEAVFEHIKGVKDVVSGYSGGSASHSSL